MTTCRVEPAWLNGALSIFSPTLFSIIYYYIIARGSSPWKFFIFKSWRWAGLISLLPSMECSSVSVWCAESMIFAWQPSNEGFIISAMFVPSVLGRLYPRRFGTDTGVGQFVGHHSRPRLDLSTRKPRQVAPSDLCKCFPVYLRVAATSSID